MRSYRKKRTRKFNYAAARLLHGLCHDRSIRIQFFLGGMTVAAGLLFSLTWWEWCFVTAAIFLVIAAEYINSAIEHIVDMISLQYHPTAKIIKDYAAAAVLLVSLMAAVIGILIFGGKLLW